MEDKLHEFTNMGKVTDLNCDCSYSGVYKTAGCLIFVGQGVHAAGGVALLILLL
jgi:hypothetical protein